MLRETRDFLGVIRMNPLSPFEWHLFEMAPDVDFGRPIPFADTDAFQVAAVFCFAWGLCFFNCYQTNTQTFDWFAWMQLAPLFHHTRFSPAHVEAGVVRPQGLQLRPKLDALQEPMSGSEACGKRQTELLETDWGIMVINYQMRFFHGFP